MCMTIKAQQNDKGTLTTPLTQEWDKTFAKSTKVSHCKVTFTNHFGITLVADLYKPDNAAAPLPAIAVCGPFGAVKEQAAGLYAQAMAERGFLTIAFDPSFTGESGGEPRYVMSPDINTEDFQAAVDYLSVRDDVDAERIGIIGICGWGGFALNTAAIDTRIKATVTSTMYDMTRVTANGYFDADDSEQARHAAREALSRQRTEDYRNGYSPRTGINPEPTDDSPQFVRDYYDYYKTARGFHPRSLNSTEGWTATGKISLLNSRILQYSDEIRSAVLMIHGEQAHSCYFSKDAYKDMTGVDGDKPFAANKQLLLIPDAVHTDLYDNTAVIPFDTMADFFNNYLK